MRRNLLKGEAPTHMDSQMVWNTCSVRLAHFAERIGGKLATFTFANLISNIGSANFPKISRLYLSVLSCRGILRHPVCYLAKRKWEKHALTSRNLLVALLQLRVGRPKFMKCQKFVWLSDDQTGAYNQPSLLPVRCTRKLRRMKRTFCPTRKISP